MTQIPEVSQTQRQPKANNIWDILSFKIHQIISKGMSHHLAFVIWEIRQTPSAGVPLGRIDR